MVALLFFTLMIGIILLNRKLLGNACISDLFTIMWFTCAGLANTGFLGLYTPGFVVNLSALFCGVFFNVVYIAFRKLSKKPYLTPAPEEFTNDIRYGLLLIVNVVALIVCLYYLPNSIHILRERGFGALRETAYAESEWASTKVLLMFQWIIQPIFIATNTITILTMILKLRYKKSLLCLSLLGIVCYTLLFGGRGIIIKFVMFTAVALFFKESGRIVQVLRHYFKVILLCVVAVGILAWLTTLRSISGFNVFANLYIYFVGPFCYLPELLAVHPVGEVMLWGGAMFNFIICFFWIAAKIFLGIDYAAGDHIITSFDAVYYQVGQNISMNAMPTMMYPFLVDFGYPGLIAGVLLFALIAALAEQNYYRSHTVRSYAILMYIGHVVLFSVQNYAFFKPESTMIILFIALFTTRVRYQDGTLKLR